VYTVGVHFTNEPENASGLLGQDVGAGFNDQYQCCSAPANFSGWYKWLLSDNEHHQHTEFNSMAMKMEATSTSRQNILYSYMV